MIHEFALEPEWVAGLPDDTTMAALITQAFQYNSGRIVAQFPKHWRRIVWDQYKRSDTVRDSRMEELLRRITERKRVRNNNRWLEARSWIQNVAVEHSERPFRGIVASTPQTGIDCLLLPQDIITDAARWSCDAGVSILRQADQFVGAVGPMLRIAKRIEIVEPNFSATRRRFRDMVGRLVRTALERRDGSDSVEIQLHTNGSRDNAPSWAAFRKECEEALARVIPEGYEIRIIRWLDRGEGADRQHNRYVMTEHGGITVGWGVEEGDDGISDDIVLMPEPVYKQRWVDYAGPKFAYEKEEGADIVVKGLAR